MNDPELKSIERSGRWAPGEINRFDGARQFVHRWDFFKRRSTPPAHGLIRATVRRSAAGNINQQGAQASALSTMLLPFQDGFEQVVEPGISELVHVFSFKLDLITYTSCEGHYYASTDKADERRIGIIPRNDLEMSMIIRLLEDCVNFIGMKSRFDVEIEIVVGTLWDRKVALPVIDLYLSRGKHREWSSYFAEIPSVTLEVVRFLIEFAAAGKSIDHFRI